MDIKVKGKQTLSGEVYPSGSKNSAVALLPASILIDSPFTLKNVPDITDVYRLVNILEKLGSKISWNKKKREIKIDNSKLNFQNLDEEDLGNMKGTSLLWGPMLARFRKVVFSDLPGGCTLGSRPLGAHFEAFRSLGVRVEETPNSAKMDATKAKAETVWLTEMSVTATENAIMLATGIKGVTKIIGAASEPHVQDLCNFLVASGAEIVGIGSSVLTINGGKKLSAADYEMLPDHYEITTFLAMAAATGGKIKVHNAIPEHMTHTNYVFSKFGVNVKYDGDLAYIKKNQKIKIDTSSTNGVVNIKAQPWPSLPVDSLPMFIPLALASKTGQVLFHNWMYESGLFWTSELTKLGANILMADPHRVLVTGGNKLRGTTLEAPYIIRAVVAMVIAAMMAEGETTILNADALYRGHPNFEENLKKLGAEIEIINK